MQTVGHGPTAKQLNDQIIKEVMSQKQLEKDNELDENILTQLPE